MARHQDERLTLERPDVGLAPRRERLVRRERDEGLTRDRDGVQVPVAERRAETDIRKIVEQVLANPYANPVEVTDPG